MTHLTIANFIGELNISVFLYNVGMLSIMSRNLYNKYEVLHKCPEIPADNMLIHTGNRDTHI